jgi:hypothetical protein
MEDYELEAIYRQLLQQEAKNFVMLPGVSYRRFISKSKGKGRLRRNPVEVELVSFTPGKWLTATEDKIDPYVNEALEGISTPVDQRDYEFLMKLLRA